jgi:hypothetical protein
VARLHQPAQAHRSVGTILMRQCCCFCALHFCSDTPSRCRSILCAEKPAARPGARCSLTARRRHASWVTQPGRALAHATASDSEMSSR